jgi:hypothetical protein
MLKITTQKNVRGTIFQLEGRLAGPWVQELESCWQRAAIADEPVRVMLKAVTFIDDGGKKLLAEMHRQGTGLTAEGCMIRAIIEEITSMSMLKGKSADTQAPRSSCAR